MQREYQSVARGSRRPEEPTGGLPALPAAMRTYRASTGWRVASIALGGPLAIGGPWGAWLVRVEAGALPRTIDWVVVGIGLALGLLGFYALVWAQRYRLTLSGHGITYHNGMWARSRRSSEFRAFRRIPGQGVPTIRLLPHLDRRPLTFPIATRPDEYLDAWLAQFEDADAAEAETSAAELLDEPALGATRQERHARLTRASRLGNGIGITSVALTFLGFWWPHRALVVVLLVFPWATLTLARALGPAVCLVGHRNSARADFSPALLLPGFGLAARAAMDVQVLRWSEVLSPLAVAAVGTLVLLFVSWPSLGVRRVGAVALMLLPHTFGAVLWGNASLDRGPAWEVPTNVLDKRVHRERNVGYSLFVDPQGAADFDGKLSVRAAAFHRVQVGAPLCLRLHPGAFGIRWVDHVPLHRAPPDGSDPLMRACGTSP